MNIFSLLGLKDGMFDRNPLKAAFEFGGGFYPQRDFRRRFSGKSKSFKKNKRRGL